LKHVKKPSKCDKARQPTRMGTWQFMSAALVMNKAAPHTFVDDLELVLYVILWLVLMYSPSSMTMEQCTAFVQGILDPKYSGTGGTTKADFLKGCTALQNITFQDRPLLPNLLIELETTSFAVRYEILVPSTPAMMAALQIHYKQRMEQLRSHKHIIKLISDAVEDPHLWPADDAAIRQWLLCPKEMAKKRTKTLYDLEEKPTKKLRLDSTDSE